MGERGREWERARQLSGSRVLTPITVMSRVLMPGAWGIMGERASLPRLKHGLGEGGKGRKSSSAPFNYLFPLKVC